MKTFRITIMAIAVSAGLIGPSIASGSDDQRDLLQARETVWRALADTEAQRGRRHVLARTQAAAPMTPASSPLCASSHSQAAANVLADYLVSDFSKSVIPATRQNGSRRTRADAWLITGEFVRVNEGNRALRGLLGLGAGGTKMETVVRVYDLSHLSKEPVLQFETSGGSNAEPGAVAGGLFGALPNALRNAGARGVTDDTARTARQITAMVGDYYAKNGGQLSGSGMKPKILAQAKQ